jgi:hypothetical protein
LFFTPDYRNRTRQRYCAAPLCRGASHAASQAAWLARPENVAYFRGPEHVARVQAWRAAHPGYSRGQRRDGRALQDRLATQVIEANEQSAVGATPPVAAPLQDLLQAPWPVLAGLIAHLFDATLQEDIAATTRRLVQLGQDVLRGGRDETRQTAALPRAAAAGAAAVQLG